MSPLEEQANECHTMGHSIETEMNEMFSLLDEWTGCDRTNTDNHWMYNKLQVWVKELNDRVSDYSHEVAEAELLEGLHEKGDIILN